MLMFNTLLWKEKTKKCLLSHKTCFAYFVSNLCSLRERVSNHSVFSQMTDVEAGGATVFPDFGAAIWPRKVTGESVVCGCTRELMCVNTLITVS